MLHGLIGEPRMLRERIKELEVQNATLLEACKLLEADLDYLQNLWGKEGITDGNVDRLRQAIAKAEGE